MFKKIVKVIQNTVRGAIMNKMKTNKDKIEEDVLEDTFALMSACGSDALNITGIECPYCKKDINIEHIIKQIRKLTQQKDRDDEIEFLRKILNLCELKIGGEANKMIEERYFRLVSKKKLEELKNDK